MHVRWLELTAFRNYGSLSFAPDPGLNALTGGNGQGKTTLLEAVYLLLSGRSFRTMHLAECVRWGAERAVVEGEIGQAGERWPVRLTLTAQSGAGAAGTLCPRARAVTFTAGDLALVTGSPQARRAYLDGAAARLVPAHTETCRRYRLVLHQRGRLLDRLAGREDAERLLAPWDEQLAALGSEIAHRRIATLETLRVSAREIWGVLTPHGAAMELAYAPAVAPAEEPAATRARYLDALAAGRRGDIRRGTTLVGPHRDDLAVRLDGASARTYASRGEQRLLALALRLTEAAAVRRRVGAMPVLVLDDLLSELDRGARERVLGWLGEQGQVIFSTTDAVALPGGPGAAWEVRRGAVGALEAVAAGDAA